MNWSDLTWETIEDCFQSILEMPFITELSNGSLPKEKFQFYMAQDSLYLEHFGRALSLIGARANDIDQALSYIRFAENAMVVEGVLHDSYFRDFGVTDKGTMQPACHHYVHFLKSTASLDYRKNSKWFSFFSSLKKIFKKSCFTCSKWSRKQDLTIVWVIETFLKFPFKLSEYQFLFHLFLIINKLINYKQLIKTKNVSIITKPEGGRPL